MPVNQLSFPNYNVNSAVDPSQWATLGNLGKVYSEAQSAEAKRRALASLGTDPQANLQTLLTSGDPTLAQLGLSLQQKEIDRQRETERNKVADAHWASQFGIQQAAQRRIEEDRAEAEKSRIQSGEILGRYGGGTPGSAPFPAPLPGAQPASPFPAPPSGPFPQATVPSAGAPAAQPPQQAAAIAPPVMAQGDEPPIAGASPELPSWASSQSLVGRVANSLVSGQPAATAGVSREELTAMAQNPLTRPLAVAFVQAKLNPGTYSFQNVAGVGLVRTNDKTGATDTVVRDTKPIELGEDKRLVQPGPGGGYVDVTPTTPGGVPPAGKEQRGRDERYADAIRRGYDENASNFYALNGKLPSMNMSPTQLKMLDTHEGAIRTGLDVIDNLNKMKELSKNAYEGLGATRRANAGALFGKNAPQAALDTLQMQNLANQNITSQLKTLFPGRVLVAELGLQKEIETLPEHPDRLRQSIADQLIRVVQHRVNEAKEVSGAIRNQTYGTPAFKPTYGRGPADASPVPPAGERPSLDTLIPLK